MSRRHEVGVGLLVVGALGLLAYMALQVGALRGSGPTVDVDAILPDAAGLSVGAVVSIAGVQVGRLEALQVEFDHARAHLSIDESAGVRRDAKLTVRARSVLGEKYLELRPQSKDAPVLVDGDVLEDTRAGVEIDEMVATMGPLLKAVDPAAIAALSDAIKNDPQRPTRMLDDAERALHNVAVASDELPALMQEAKTTLADVRGTAASARGTLAKADRAVERVDQVTAQVDPAQIDRLLDDAEATLKDGRAAVEHADRTLGKVDAAADSGRKLLDGWKDADWETFRRVAQETGVYVRLSPVGKK